VLCYAVAMPRFEPFSGLRYDAARVDVSMVVAPPYDVIGPQDRSALVARHSANAVLVELPAPDRRAGLDRYANAARLLEQWQEEGLVVRDPCPSLYAYRMTPSNGRPTNGVIGALGIDDKSAGAIRLHEQTLPKAKSDRLDLLTATRANLSPIWGLSLDPGLSKTFQRDDAADARAVDGDGVLHEVWVIDDAETIRDVQARIAGSDVVLADGHHRYETARAYRSERRPATNRDTDDRPSGDDLVMALIVELSEDQLNVGPIHRALSGLPDGLDLVDACSSWFDVTRAGDFDERTTSALAESGALALIMPSGAWLLSPKDGTPEAAGSNLDSSMVALVIAELPEHELTFLNSWQDGIRAVASEEVQAVLLLRPVSVDQIAEWAQAGRRMPPKSTFFYPKPRTGMVFRTLDEPAQS
jgi:uncharacterized protein (DUF1015 family)